MEKYLNQLIAWRRHLHQHPELSFQEVETSRYIAAEMGKLKNVAAIERLTPTSVVVVFKTGRPGTKLGLRADIDALPIQEERDELPFKSQNDGVMHACGHDGHTAVLMAACQYIDDHIDEFSGEIHAIFQHAEEQPLGGAAEMVATGYFDDFDYIYGHHLFSTSETGILDIKDGAAALVDLGGIVHVVLEAAFPAAAEAFRARHRALCAQLDLAARPAVGVIWCERAHGRIAIHPVVWVREVDSFFYESSCGSGSIAAAAVCGVGTVRQPSGREMDVTLDAAGIALASEMAVLDGVRVS